MKGLVVIVLHKNDWSVYPLPDLALVLHPYRRLYEIPIEHEERNIFVNTRCRESTCDEIQALTRSSIVALKEGDIPAFGKDRQTGVGDKKAVASCHRQRRDRSDGSSRSGSRRVGLENMRHRWKTRIFPRSRRCGMPPTYQQTLHPI